PRGESLRRLEELSRLGQPPQRAVELIDQALPAAPCQAVARQREQLADRCYAYLPEEGCVAADDRNRQVCKRKAPAPRAPQRRAGGRGRGERGLHAELGQASLEGLHQARASAVVAQAALDLGEQRLRRLERDL